VPQFVFQIIYTHINIQQVKLKICAEKHVPFSSHSVRCFRPVLPKTETCRQITVGFF